MIQQIEQGGGRREELGMFHAELEALGNQRGKSRRQAGIVNRFTEPKSDGGPDASQRSLAILFARSALRRDDHQAGRYVTKSNR
jgi:hypothetical protein